jgi:hypothetical protein
LTTNAPIDRGQGAQITFLAGQAATLKMVQNVPTVQVVQIVFFGFNGERFERLEPAQRSHIL